MASVNSIGIETAGSAWVIRNDILHLRGQNLQQYHLFQIALVCTGCRSQTTGLNCFDYANSGLHTFTTLGLELVRSAPVCLLVNDHSRILTSATFFCFCRGHVRDMHSQELVSRPEK